MRNIMILMMVLVALCSTLVAQQEHRLVLRNHPLNGAAGLGNFLTDTIELATGSASNLSLRFRGDPDTGFISPSAGRITFISNGSTKASFDAGGAGEFYITSSLSGLNSNGAGTLQSVVSASSTPVWSFRGNTNTGLGRNAVGEPSMVASGVEAMRWTNTEVTSKVAFTSPQYLASSTTPVATTTFPTTGFSYASGGIDVYLGGIHQRPSSDYTETSSSLITFTTLIATGTPVDIHRK